LITYVTDWFCLVSFSMEIALKVKRKGLLRPEGAFLRDRSG
jgi:hypothetical protein